MRIIFFIFFLFFFFFYRRFIDPWMDADGPLSEFDQRWIRFQCVLGIANQFQYTRKFRFRGIVLLSYIMYL